MKVFKLLSVSTASKRFGKVVLMDERLALPLS